jgi:hypothetical protein
MHPAKFLFLGIATAAVTLLSSCSITQKKGAGLAAYRGYDLPAKLPSDPDRVTVKVSLRKQRAYVMEGTEMLLVMPVSVGAPETPTPTGHFRILQKEEKKRHRGHGYAYHGTKTKRAAIHNTPPGWKFKGTPLPFWCEFKPGYGFHTGWIKHYPCTQDGCVRMHENLAPKFYQLVKVGTPVSIAYSQPEDATAPRIPLPPDGGPLPDYDGMDYVNGTYFTRHQAPKFDESRGSR